MSLIEIRVGSGSITIDEDLITEIRNRYIIIMRTKMENGPCQDGMCQIIRQLEVSVEDKASDNLLFFGDQTMRIAMDGQTYRSINKGRENVRIKRGRSGIQVSGFTYVT
ncbi:hypothetical protein [Thermoplasma sp.]|uniref:hypothetical protein n=1 Tax=Thermoplasma sp. TaxID=1973142 RepID=UPI0025E1547C|nr:hypothetical protein [Thermoplasma sp.]